MGHGPISPPRNLSSPRRPPPPLPPSAMNALEILRETARLLRSDPSPFLAALALLISPLSAAILSDFLATPSAVRRLSLLLSSATRLPPSLLPLHRHLAAALLSSAPFLPLLLLARAAVARSVAASYSGRRRHASTVYSLALLSLPQLSTYLYVCLSMSGFLLLSLALLAATCNALAALGYPPAIILYPAALSISLLSVAYAYAAVVSNLAVVVSVLEDVPGPRALSRSVRLVRGQTRAGLSIFLGSTVGMGFVQGLFEHRVRTLSYGDGSSRLWEGPLLVIMYSFVVLVDSMMSTVFYFTCRSSSSVEEEPECSLEDAEKLAASDDTDSGYL